MIPHIHHVESNLKWSSLSKVDGNKTGHYVLVTGPNGSGKSALIHSIELACFGKVYDAAGRDVKSKGSVKHLSNDSLSAQVHLSDGTIIAWPSTVRPYIDAMGEAMNAVTGSTMNLVLFLLKRDPRLDEVLTEVDIQWSGWKEYCKRFPSYRQALLSGYEGSKAALREVRANIKLFEAMLKHVDDPEKWRHRLALERVKEERAKEISKGIETSLKQWIKSRFKIIEDQMKVFFPDPEGETNWSRIGPPKFHVLGKDVRLGYENAVVPSGAETVMLAAALAAAVIEGPKLFILPDRAYDAKTLGHMMRVLRTIPNAVVWVQSTVMPEGYDAVALGWQIIQLKNN